MFGFSAALHVGAAAAVLLLSSAAARPNLIPAHISVSIIEDNVVEESPASTMPQTFVQQPLEVKAANNEVVHVAMSQEPLAPIAQAVEAEEAQAQPVVVMLEAPVQSSSATVLASEPLGQASGVTQAGLSNEASNANVASITRRVNISIQYPQMARRRGWQGRVLAGFSVQSDGRPAGIRIVESSGYGALDDAVLTAIRSNGPYPEVNGEMQLPVTFKLAD